MRVHLNWVIVPARRHSRINLVLSLAFMLNQVPDPIRLVLANPDGIGEDSGFICNDLDVSHAWFRTA